MKVDFKQGAKAEKRSGFSLCYVAPVMQFSYNTILKGNVHYTVCKNSVSECQFGCVILKMVGPKMQDFCPRIMVRQKVPKLYFQSPFSMSKIDRFFSKKFI